MRLTINLDLEVDDTQSIADMRAEVLRDVEAWLSSAPVMSQLAEAEDVLKVTHD